MTSPNLIALYSPRPGSGKSEFAKALVEGRGFVVFKLASALKDMLRSLFRSSGMGELEIEDCLEGSKKETPIPLFGYRTPRYLMQTLGTEWGRNLVAGNLWIELALMRISSALKDGKRVVVDDMRFINEMFMLQSLGATRVYINRPKEATAQVHTHPSEGALDRSIFEHVIENNSDLNSLKTKAYNVADHLAV